MTGNVQLYLTEANRSCLRMGAPLVGIRPRVKIGVTRLSPTFDKPRTGGPPPRDGLGEDLAPAPQKFTRAPIRNVRPYVSK